MILSEDGFPGGVCRPSKLHPCESLDRQYANDGPRRILKLYSRPMLENYPVSFNITYANLSPLRTSPQGDVVMPNEPGLILDWLGCINRAVICTFSED